MARETGHEENTRVSLQLEADRTGPKKRLSMVTYLAVLFAGAFLLLLFSYMMELRNQANEEAVIPAMTAEEKNRITEENVKLRTENEEIRIHINGLEERIAELEKEISALETWQRETQSTETAEGSPP